MSTECRGVRGTWGYACRIVVVALLLASTPFPVFGEPGDTARVSVDSLGIEGNAGSEAAALSGDGQFVSFTSSATNLVPDDDNGFADIFVHDRSTGETTRVSIDSNGNPANGASASSAISADGSVVAFSSSASNLVDGDTNNRQDIFVHDRITGLTTRVSVATNGDQSNGFSENPSISADGRYVAFQSSASNFAPGDSFPSTTSVDVFVHDRVTGETTRVSEPPGSGQPNGLSQNPAISADGRFVAFESQASNLVAGDTNSLSDIFVHERDTGDIVRASVANNGDEGNSSSFGTAISGDGRYVVFQSSSNNLVPEPPLTAGIYVRDLVDGTTELASVSSEGVPGFGATFSQVGISGDGRYVAFLSRAANLVADPINNNVNKLFVRDRAEGKTVRASNSSNGVPAETSVGQPAISGDGKFVAFDSLATNLVPDDTNGARDVFVHEPLFIRIIFKDGFEEPESSN